MQQTTSRNPGETAPGVPRDGVRRIPHLRWAIGVMLFAAAILNYVDRQALSLLKPTIQADLRLTEHDYALVNNLFLAAYTAAYLLSGRLVDAWGPRASMAVFLTWWSVANALTALARSAASLGFFRFLLGLGEAGNWPASAKAVSEWFPARERAVAIGFYTLGATLGATVAPPLIIYLNARFGWRSAFVVTGLFGLCWVLPWLWLYRRPREHPRITAKELALLDASARAEGEPSPPAGASTAPPPRESERARWRAALSIRAVWLLMLARMLSDPVWYFYQFWFPSYLAKDWGVDQQGLARTWVVFLAADAGTLLGGFGSALLIRGGTGAARARLWVMLACAAVVPLSPLVTRAPSLGWALAVAMAVVFAHLAWLANISALVVDVIPRARLATCFGIAAAGSALGGMVMNKLVADLAAAGNYAAWFALMACLHPVAWLLLWFGGVHRPAAAGGSHAG